MVAATGFVALETVQISNLTVPGQAFGAYGRFFLVLQYSKESLLQVLSLLRTFLPAVKSVVFWVLDFLVCLEYSMPLQMVSRYPQLVPIRRVNTDLTIATPVFSTMSERGQLNYPLFGLSLTRNQPGSLSFGTCRHLELPMCALFITLSFKQAR